MEAARRILAQFDLPPSMKEASLSALGRGHINRTLLAKGSDGAACVLQRLNPLVFPNGEAVMENFSRVCAHLREQLLREGVPAAQADDRALRLIKTRDGHDWVRDKDGALWRCMPHLNNTRTLEKLENTHQAYHAAFAFGTFIRRLADLPPPALKITIPDFHNTKARLSAFLTALKTDRVGRAAEIAFEADFVAAREKLAGELSDKGLAQCTVHNDTKLNNVLFDARGEQALCVVDLDTVMPGLLLHDFGDMARSAANAAAEDERDLSRVFVDETVFAALARGFRAGAGPVVSREEVASFPLAAETIVFECALRFLTDYLDGDRYFNISRPKQNLERARVHLRLLESFENARKRLLQTVLDED